MTDGHAIAYEDLERLVGARGPPGAEYPVADARDVPVQHAVMMSGTTDATELQRVRGGRHAGAVAVPCRYTHSPVETASLVDADRGVDLLVEALDARFPSRTEVRGA